MRKGFSLIETLVVVAIFAMVAIVVSRATAVSIVGSRKSDSSSKVRENLVQAVSVIERRLRSARAITTTCTGTPAQLIRFKNENGGESSFSCNPSTTCSSSSNTYVSYIENISSPSPQRMTSPQTLCITLCEFVCRSPGANLPPTIEITIEGRSKETSGVEDTTVRLETGVNLRTY